MTEKPITRMDHSDLPLWQQVNAIFARNGLWPPSTGLRDELVTILAWARYGEAVADAAPVPKRGRLTAEAERDALAADKARLEAVLTEAQEFIIDRMHEHDDEARRVHSVVIAALSIPAPADKAEAQALKDGLREAVGALYNCRYSEVPLAKKLDALLKRVDGEGYHERITREFLISTPARREGDAT